jgi:hypothetical protein
MHLRLLTKKYVQVASHVNFTPICCVFQQILPQIIGGTVIVIILQISRREHSWHLVRQAGRLRIGRGRVQNRFPCGHHGQQLKDRIEEGLRINFLFGQPALAECLDRLVLSSLDLNRDYLRPQFVTLLLYLLEPFTFLTVADGSVRPPSPKKCDRKNQRKNSKERRGRARCRLGGRRTSQIYKVRAWR